MITETILEYNIKSANNKVTIKEIENFIKSKGIEPVRYCLLERKENIIKIGVSGIKNADL